MKLYRVCGILVLFVGASAVNLLRILKYLVGLDFAPTIKNPSYNNLTATTASAQAFHFNNITTTIQSVTAAPRRRLCTRQEIQKGAWRPITLDRPPYISKNEHLRCYPSSTYNKRPWNTYDWQPSSDDCEFTKWNKDTFCSLMKRVTVLVIGDSLSWEQFSSMGQLLGERIHQNTQHQSKQYQHNFVQLACQKMVRLVFRRDDTLMNVSDAIRNTFPQVLIMNRGAHYVNDTRLLSGIRRNLKEIQYWQESCKRMNIKCHLFWRTSVPGHPHCDQFTKPINDVAVMEAYIANRSNYNDRSIKYHWYDYQHQNELVVREFEKTLGWDNFDVLDAYHLNILRPDEHRAHQEDCLHSCYPGKMDVYSQLMLHFIKMRRNQADIDRLVMLFDRENSKQRNESKSRRNETAKIE